MSIPTDPFLGPYHVLDEPLFFISPASHAFDEPVQGLIVLDVGQLRSTRGDAKGTFVCSQSLSLTFSERNMMCRDSRVMRPLKDNEQWAIGSNYSSSDEGDGTLAILWGSFRL